MSAPTSALFFLIENKIGIYTYYLIGIYCHVLNFFNKGSRNPWLEKDRRDQVRIIVTALILIGMLLLGIGLLVYALVH